MSQCSKVATCLPKVDMKKLSYQRPVDDSWRVHIPKEQNSKDINQFRPISLLNVEGKIFFAILASRLTKYLLTNEYIDTSVRNSCFFGTWFGWLFKKLKLTKIWMSFGWIWLMPMDRYLTKWYICLFKCTMFLRKYPVCKALTSMDSACDSPQRF